MANMASALPAWGQPSSNWETNSGTVTGWIKEFGRGERWLKERRRALNDRDPNLAQRTRRHPTKKLVGVHDFSADGLARSGGNCRTFEVMIASVSETTAGTCQSAGYRRH
jgi:hypothetical protein